jgi:hypothetical protein
VLERDLLDVLNGGSKAELMQMSAIGAKRADKIVDSRPFYQVRLCSTRLGRWRDV